MCHADEFRIVVVRGGDRLDFVVVQHPDHLDGKGLSRCESFRADQDDAIRKVVNGCIGVVRIPPLPGGVLRRNEG